MIVTSSRGGFAVSCENRCGEGLVLGSKTLEDAREHVIAAGWREDRRKGGVRKSVWMCPSCGKPSVPLSGVVTSADTTHGYRQRTRP